MARASPLATRASTRRAIGDGANGAQREPHRARDASRDDGSNVHSLVERRESATRSSRAHRRARTARDEETVRLLCVIARASSRVRAMTSCASNGRAAAGKTTGMGARAVRRARERDDALARRTRAKERLPSVRARSNAGDSSRGRRRECVVYWDLDNATPPTDAEVRAFARRDREEASPRSHRLCFSFFFATRRCARFARLTSSPFFHHVNRGLNGRATATSTVRSSSNPRPWVEEFMRSRHSRHSRHSRARVFAFAFFLFSFVYD